MTSVAGITGPGHDTLRAYFPSSTHHWCVFHRMFTAFGLQL